MDSDFDSNTIGLDSDSDSNTSGLDSDLDSSTPELGLGLGLGGLDYITGTVSL